MRMAKSFLDERLRIAMKPLKIEGQAFIRTTFNWRFTAILERGRWTYVSNPSFVATASIPEYVVAQALEVRRWTYAVD